MIAIEKCAMCGGYGECLTPFNGQFWHEECLGENESFQEYEKGMENEMLAHRKNNPKFYNDIAIETAENIINNSKQTEKAESD